MATEEVTLMQPNIVHKYYGSGDAALADTTGALTNPASFKDLSLHLGSAPGSADAFTVTLDSARGGSYDAVLYSGPVNGITDFVLDRADFDVTLGAADALDIAWTNLDGVDYGFEITLIEGVF